MEAKKSTNKFSSEVRERAVRMVQEHRGEYPSEWAALNSIASKFGCTGETLRNWMRQAERDAGSRAGLTTDERARLKALERENVSTRRGRLSVRSCRISLITLCTPNPLADRSS
jgi:transposase